MNNEIKMRINMMNAYRTNKFDDNDKIKAVNGAQGYCVFCHKPLCAINIENFYSFECGCKKEQKYYRTS